MDKITVIGYMGSGKTSYLAGMYDYMSKGVGNLTLYESSGKDWYLHKLWQDIRTGSWPVPSDDKNTYAFSLLRNYLKVMDFEWLDYPGAALVDPGYGLVEDITSQISESACLLLLINGESFAFQKDKLGDLLPIQAGSPQEYMQIVKSNLEETQVSAINTKLSQLGAAGIKLPPVCIVVTKSDLIDDQWVPYTLSILQNSFSPVFGKSNSDERIVMLSAVTLLGNGYPHGTAEPEDVEFPIAYAVLSTLHKHFTVFRQLKEKKEKQLKDQDTGWNRFFFAENLAQLRTEIKELNDSMEQWRKDANHLIALFDDEKPIYINGQKQNLHSFFDHEFR